MTDKQRADLPQSDQEWHDALHSDKSHALLLRLAAAERVVEAGYVWQSASTEADLIIASRELYDALDAIKGGEGCSGQS